jgi:hypothetical protein
MLLRNGYLTNLLEGFVFPWTWGLVDFYEPISGKHIMGTGIYTHLWVVSHWEADLQVKAECNKIRWRETNKF